MPERLHVAVNIYKSERDITYDSWILLLLKLKWNMSYAIRTIFQIMTRLLNGVDLTLAATPVQNTYCTYCSVYIQVKRHPVHRGKPSATSRLASSQHVVQADFAGCCCASLV